MTETGVVLTGGGARAAYQIGVLRAVSDMYPDWEHPFRVIVGTSAGAINALAIASGGGIFRHNISRLERIWSELSVDKIFRTHTYDVLRNVTGLARKLFSGGVSDLPLSLLNNDPLHKLLSKELDFDEVHRTIADGRLSAVGLNACGYTTGQNLCFFDGHEGLQSWSSGQRAGSRTRLELKHVMASSAIPTVFPPVAINREYFGDGVTRQMAHVSPALRLGAERVLVIGVSSNGRVSPSRPEKAVVPTFAQVVTHMFNGMFLDTLDYDIDRLRMINRLVELIPPDKLESAGLDLKPVRLLEISPSQEIDDIASKYLDGLPLLLRNLIGATMIGNKTGASLASYLLFDHRFCRDLISLGYRDAQTQAREIDAFFRKQA